MANAHPAAPHHLPGFLPGPDGSDPLFTVVVVVVLLVLMTVGVLYFRLHSLPEQMAERRNSTQILLISVLALLALFTHNNAFWVLALLLAVIRIPDFLTPLNTIANSLERLASDAKLGDSTQSNRAVAADSSKDAAPAEKRKPAESPTAKAGKVED